MNFEDIVDSKCTLAYTATGQLILPRAFRNARSACYGLGYGVSFAAGLFFTPISAEFHVPASPGWEDHCSWYSPYLSGFVLVCYQKIQLRGLLFRG